MNSITTIIRPHNRISDALRGHKGRKHTTGVATDTACSICDRAAVITYNRKNTTVNLCMRCRHIRTNASRVRINFDTTIRLISDVHAELPTLLSRAHIAFDRMLFLRHIWHHGELKQRTCMLCFDSSAYRYVHKFAGPINMYICASCTAYAKIRVCERGHVLTIGLYVIGIMDGSGDIRRYVRELFLRAVM